MIVKLTDKASCFLPPEGAMDIELHRLPHVNKTYISWHPKGAMINDGIHIDGQWTALGFSDSLAEHEAAKVVRRLETNAVTAINGQLISTPLYENYLKKRDITLSPRYSANASMESLLQSKECYSKNPYGDRKDDLTDNNGRYYDPNQTYEGWERLQERVGRWFIILKQE